MAWTSITVYTGMGSSNNSKDYFLYESREGCERKMRQQPQPKSYIHSSYDLAAYGCTVRQQYYWYDILDHILSQINVRYT